MVLSDDQALHESSAMGHSLGYWGSSLPMPKRTKEPEIITITLTGPQKVEDEVPTQRKTNSQEEDESKSKSGYGCNKSPSQVYKWSWGDRMLKKLTKKGKRGANILWLPGSARHVDEGKNSYRLFTHIVRTLHLTDAVNVCTTGRIPPKNIVTFSSLDSRDISRDHPCVNLKVLWFSASVPHDDEDLPDWYGNVEFAVDAKLLRKQWKNCFLVEMMTTPTHTTSRLLVTNSDYSSVLPRYDPGSAGGPWHVTSVGQFALIECSRYKFQGTNQHDHVLEFLIEVTPADEKKILSECQLSFKNHEDAADTKVPHVCNRYQRLGQSCPTPFSRIMAADSFFRQQQEKQFTLGTKSTPKLSPSAKDLEKLSLSK